VALLYISVQLVAQGVLGSSLAAPETATAPLAAAAQLFAGPSGARLILVAMALSTFGFMTGMMLSTPRTLFALAADGFLPRPLARVHPAYRTPHFAILIQAVISGGIAVTGTYVKLAILANVALLLVYLACCVGASRLRRRKVGADRKPFVMPAGSVVPWLAAALIVGLLARATLSAWLLTGGVIAVASLGYLARSHRSVPEPDTRE
jgi:amino acid transporter